MSRQTRGILFIFYGQEPTEELIGVVANEIAKRCNAESNLDSFIFDAEDLSKCIVSSINATDKFATKKIDEHTPEEKAVIYVGTVMKDALAAPFDTTEFIGELTSHVMRAKMSPTKTESKELMNALFILSMEDLVISQSLMKKYNLSQKKIEIIKRVYNMISKFQRTSWEKRIETDQQKNAKQQCLSMKRGIIVEWNPMCGLKQQNGLKIIN